MEDWPYYLSIALCLFLTLLPSSFRLVAGMAGTPPLPPGPTALTAALGLGPLLLLAWTSFNIESIINIYRAWYGPVFTIHLLPSFPVIFVADPAVARRVLVQRGATFAGRPPANLATRIFSCNQHTVTTAPYGPLWRALRRNLTAGVLHPSSVLRRHAPARHAAASGLVEGVKQQMRADGGDSVVVVEGLLHQAVYRVLTAMCFGEGLDGSAVAAVEELHREFLKSVVGFQVFGGVITKLLFWRRYRKMLTIRQRQEELIIPLIRARRRRRDAGAGDDDAACYVDSLIGLRIPEADGGGGGRSLTELEFVSLCTEFLSGADSMVTALQWTMANLVAQPEI
ncbi:unnamed protein product [Urochloa humidicola]